MKEKQVLWRLILDQSLWRLRGVQKSLIGRSDRGRYYETFLDEWADVYTTIVLST